MATMRVYCWTCLKEVGASHRLPETQWLHRINQLPIPLLEREVSKSDPKFTSNPNAKRSTENGQGQSKDQDPCI
jgi:hypothetical protein